MRWNERILMVILVLIELIVCCIVDYVCYLEIFKIDSDITMSLLDVVIEFFRNK